MKYAKVIVCVDDDFEPGVCSECPLAYTDQDNLGDFYCALSSGYWECPLEVSEDDD